MPEPERQSNPFVRIFAFLASYGVAAVILTLLLLLTFLGTLEQVDHGLFAVQERYFNSLFLVHHFFGILPVPLPGAYLLMVLLFINLVCGAIIRAPKRWRRPGMLIAHSGILLLLLGGFVTFRYSIGGNMRLYEGEASSEFESYTGWVLEIVMVDAPAGEDAFIIPESDFADMAPGDTRIFHSERLPFEFEISGYGKNTRVEPMLGSHSMIAVDGFYLMTLPRDPEEEQNVAGAYVTVVEKESGKRHEGILWPLETHPYTVEIDGVGWAFLLRRPRWTVPFTIVLDKFTMEKHPGTNMPKVFLSDVTKIEGKSQEQIKIEMNEPLRYKGYTFFQASWGPQEARPGDRLFSVFAVVRNPADKWPLYACIVITAGLLVHFCQKLLLYLRREHRRHPAL
jgi:hypothetical protein